MAQRIRNFADKYLNKFMSRKLFTLILATILLGFGVLTPDVWSTIAYVYIGAEGIRDTVIAYRQQDTFTMAENDNDNGKDQDILEK